VAADNALLEMSTSDAPVQILVNAVYQFTRSCDAQVQRSELGQIPESQYKPPGWRPAA